MVKTLDNKNQDETIHFDSNTIDNRNKNAIQERLRCEAKAF